MWIVSRSLSTEVSNFDILSVCKCVVGCQHFSAITKILYRASSILQFELNRALDCPGATLRCCTEALSALINNHISMSIVRPKRVLRKVNPNVPARPGMTIARGEPLHSNKSVPEGQHHSLAILSLLPPHLLLPFPRTSRRSQD